MRLLIRLLDSWLRQVYGVFEFWDDPTCLLRLQLTRAPGGLRLGSDGIMAGEAVVELHLWNEHIPPLPAAGPDWGWANHAQRLFVRSLQAAARELKSNPRFKDVKAIRAVSVLLSPGDHSGGARLMQRLGFVVVPCHHRLGRFGEFWENFYGWWLMWAFNKVSLRRRQFSRLRRMEAWMAAGEFISRYGERLTAEPGS